MHISLYCNWWLYYYEHSSSADVDRYFATPQVTEAENNCDPDKVVSTVRKMVALNQDDSTYKSAVNMLESALKINPLAEVNF